MPRFEITGPDGHKYEVTAPEGATEQDALAHLQNTVASGTAQQQPPSMSLDEYGRPMTPITQEAAAAPLPNTAVGRVGQAAAEGWQKPPFLTPEAKAKAEAENQQTWVGRNVVSPLVSVSEVPFRALNAIGGGIGQATYEGGAALGGPEAGRDAFMLNQLAPFLFPGAPIMRREGAPSGPPPGGKFVSERMAPAAEPGATPLDRMTQLIRHDDAEVAGRLPEVPAQLSEPVAAAPGDPQPGMGPRAAGAAPSPAGAAELTPREIKANRREAEMGEINAPPQPGDTTIHVEGSYPTLAQRSGDPAISQKEVMLRQLNPNAFEGEGGVLTQQNTARVKKLEDITPSDTLIDGWRTERARLAEADTKTVMANARPADLQPALDHLDAVLRDPRIRENPDIVKTMTTLRESLFDESGQLKTDPLSVWGMHDRLIAMMDKAKDPLNASSAEKFAFSQLTSFKPIIDDVMNTATGGHFQTFLDHHAELSQKINAGELLNKYRQLGATNAKGQLLADRFHKFVADLGYSRGRPGLHPSMDIPDETMRSLIAIDTDLKRAGQIDLGKARGSPTYLFGELAKNLGVGLAHVGTAAVTGGNVTGNLMLQGVIKGGGSLIDRLRTQSLTQKHLAPPPGGWQPPRNDLIP